MNAILKIFFIFCTGKLLESEQVTSWLHLSNNVPKKYRRLIGHNHVYCFRVNFVDLIAGGHLIKWRVRPWMAYNTGRETERNREKTNDVLDGFFELGGKLLEIFRICFVSCFFHFFKNFSHFLKYWLISWFFKVVRSNFSSITKITGPFFKNRLFLS